MQFSTLCVVKRTRSVRHGMRRGAPHDSCDHRSRYRPQLRISAPASFAILRAL
ncbi:hypothetical protein ALO59_102579 [Pseudomonas amygdali pv. mellea]|nr:hypothetical protein ALO59_102579 [Pseudomonas amygdali pv. mellea]